MKIDLQVIKDHDVQEKFKKAIAYYESDVSIYCWVRIIDRLISYFHTKNNRYRQ